MEIWRHERIMYVNISRNMSRNISFSHAYMNSCRVNAGSRLKNSVPFIIQSPCIMRITCTPVGGAELRSEEGCAVCSRQPHVPPLEDGREAFRPHVSE